MRFALGLKLVGLDFAGHCGDIWFTQKNQSGIAIAQKNGRKTEEGRRIRYGNQAIIATTKKREFTLRRASYLRSQSLGSKFVSRTLFH